MRASIFDRRALALALFLGLGLALAGCFVSSDDAPKTTRFQHWSHIQRGLDCTDCHADAAKGARVAMPSADSCRDCHNGKEQIPADVAAAISEYIFRPAESQHARPSHYADVLFSHTAHVTSAQVSCATCHGNLSGLQPNPVEPLTMNACTTCHGARSVPTDCKTCHEVWSRDYKPPTHLALWDVRHGPASRMAMKEVTLASSESCNLCHARTSCDQCHAIQKPRNHTEAWRTRTHGLAAAMDRTSCQACHPGDSCERCHLNAPPPTSHRANYGSPRDMHCLTCHDQLSQSACNVCHKGTPDHALAPPKPPNHTPGLNCRQCHGHGQPLLHVDNGMDCNSCHH
jgi:hypothetical protein